MLTNMELMLTKIELISTIIYLMLTKIEAKMGLFSTLKSVKSVMFMPPPPEKGVIMHENEKV